MLSKSKVKYIQSLGQKKQRDDERLFIAEGPKIVAELLQDNPDGISHVYALPSWVEERRIDLSSSLITEVSVEELARISQLHTPNQVLAVMKQFPESPVPPLKGSIALALDTIQDPGNLGTIIRIADWFGIPRIICSHNCADQYNPKVVQSTMGSIGRVQVHYTDLEAWLGSLTDVPVYAAALQGQDILQMKRLTEGVIVIGNESKGISPAVMEKVNVRLTIPQKGKAESLNAAVATGIIVSHLV
ncbi:RNA methyltransferase [Terrimonas sp. NA20]|uniref:RNA methyltransferase n=1 Tax=Terrimonas ginsenosidimutans TaxID=2908004 RepID=A0ABS9KTR1_9BACT|nr:RNA methyltransferase [Terrimonas ginsenosidimutans]MCG2615685.1 RNA methyltransferase [Terrimonas ginsenosidimutans]